MRGADFLTVSGKANPNEVAERGYDSLSDDDEEGRGLEYACDGNSNAPDGFVEISDLV